MSTDAPQDEGFLSRWSRRKRKVAEPEVLPVPPAPMVELSAEAATESKVAATEIVEPEMVEPPSLDLIDKDFNVAHWLKQNVPESWKLAAMRRAWESDPAIAGFENPARDYALDWNTPGGAPGYGPLTESDDVGAMVRAIFGEPPPPDPPAIAADDVTSDGVSHQLSSNDQSDQTDAATQKDLPPQTESASVRLSEPQDSAVKDRLNAPVTVQPIYAAAQHRPDSEEISPRIRKRGGGAIPI